MIILFYSLLSWESFESKHVVNQNYIGNEALVSTVDFHVQSAVSWERSIRIVKYCAPPSHTLTHTHTSPPLGSLYILSCFLRINFGTFISFVFPVYIDTVTYFLLISYFKKHVSSGCFRSRIRTNHRTNPILLFFMQYPDFCIRSLSMVVQQCLNAFYLPGGR